MFTNICLFLFTGLLAQIEDLDELTERDIDIPAWDFFIEFLSSLASLGVGLVVILATAAALGSVGMAVVMSGNEHKSARWWGRAKAFFVGTVILLLLWVFFGDILGLIDGVMDTLRDNI